MLHEIVSNAETILQSLPGSQRLPTDALFQASDETLSYHGIAPEDAPHISRLLFKIGGMRGPETLLEKFGLVLAEMGIEIDYTNDPLAFTESPDPPSLDVSDEDDDDNALTTPKAPLPDLAEDALPPRPSTSLAAQQEAVNSFSPMHYAPRRRRNSDSIAFNFASPNHEVHDGENHKLAPTLSRAHSTAGVAPQVSEPHKKEVRFSDVVDSQTFSELTYEQDPSGEASSTIENIPFRPKSANGSAHPSSETQAGQDARPSTSAENRAPPDFSRFGQQGHGFPSHTASLPNGDVLSDEEFSSIDMADLVGLRAGRQAREPSLPTQVEERDDGPAAGNRDASETTESHADLRHDEYSIHLPLRNVTEEKQPDRVGKIKEPHIRIMDSREQTFKMSSFNHWRSVAGFNARAKAHADWQNELRVIGGALETWVESALTMHVDQNEGHHAYQEHVRQMQSRERSREAGDLDVEDDDPFENPMAGGSVHPRVRQSLERSRSSLGSGHRSMSDLRAAERHPSQSVDRTWPDDAPDRPFQETDMDDARAEQLQSLGREWERERLRQSIENDDDLYYDAEEDMEEQETAREGVFHSQYQIAAAAWDYFLVSKAFTHWANRAAEEVQRTEVARRHILRRKCFNAWLLEGQNDETEAESKAVWFSQLNVLKNWRDTAVTSARKNEKLERMAVLREWKDGTEDALAAWYQASKFQLAEAIDAYRLRTACLQHWSAESQWLASAHEEAEGIWRATTLGRYMRCWTAEARIQERAEQGAGPIITRRDEFLRAGLALAWRHEAEEAKAREKVAIRQELSGLAKHWLYETRLIAWQEEQDAELLDTASYHWYCEWRLILCQRVLDQYEKARFVEKWADAAKTASERKFHLRHLARDVRHHDSITGFFNASMDALEQLETQADRARGMIVQRTAPKVVRKWTGQLDEHRKKERWSQLARFFAASEDVLPHWQAIRKQEWKRRMHRLYTDYKYRANRDLVERCIGTWWQATADTIAQGWEADDMIVQDDNALVASITEAWRSKAEYVTFSTEVADDADREVQLTLWHSLLEGQDEGLADAAEYEFVQTARACCDEWTLTSVALRGQEHAVQEFQGHKTRRDLRHFFATWASQTSAFARTNPSFGSSRSTLLPLGESLLTVTGGGAGDNNNKNLSFRATLRRSSRWTTMGMATTPIAAAPTPRPRNTVDYTPFRTPARPSSFRMSTTTPKYRPPSELTFDEVLDEEEEGEYE